MTAKPQNSTQAFTCVYDHRKGNRNVFHYHVCYSTTPGNSARPAPWVRVTTITAVTVDKKDYRLSRVADSGMWDLIRSCVVSGDTHIYTAPGKGVAAK